LQNFIISIFLVERTKFEYRIDKAVIKHVF